MTRVTLELRPRETGLAAVTAGPRSYEIRVNGREVGWVSPLGGHRGTPVRGWYFVARDDEIGIPLRNTCGEVGLPLEDVKKSAVAYVKQCLEARAAVPSSVGEETKR